MYTWLAELYRPARSSVCAHAQVFGRGARCPAIKELGLVGEVEAGQAPRGDECGVTAPRASLEVIEGVADALSIVVPAELRLGELQGAAPRGVPCREQNEANERHKAGNPTLCRVP